MLFEAAFRKAYADLREAGLELCEDTWHPLVVQLAKNCFASGLPQEEVVKRTISTSICINRKSLSGK